jgi:hypothetical protein
MQWFISGVTLLQLLPLRFMLVQVELGQSAQPSQSMASQQAQSVPRQLVELSTQMLIISTTSLQVTVPLHQHNQSLLTA